MTGATDLEMTTEMKAFVSTFWTDRVRGQAAMGSDNPGAPCGERARMRAPASRRYRRLACVLIMAGLGLAAVAPVLAQQEGDVRNKDDVVQIRHDGQWGGVCDDYWT